MAIVRVSVAIVRVSVENLDLTKVDSIKMATKEASIKVVLTKTAVSANQVVIHQIKSPNLKIKPIQECILDIFYNYLVYLLLVYFHYSHELSILLF